MITKKEYEKIYSYKITTKEIRSLWNKIIKSPKKKKEAQKIEIFAVPFMLHLNKSSKVCMGVVGHGN